MARVAWILVVASLLACAPRGPKLAAEAIRKEFPTAVRDRVGVTPDRVGRFGPATPDVDARIRRLVRERSAALEACATSPRLAWATFLVDANGFAQDPVVVARPADAALEACVAKTIGGWTFTGADAGGFFWTELRAGAKGELPSEAGPPREAERGCVGRAVRLPGDARPRSLTVFVDVREDGGVGEVRTSGSSDPEIVDAVERAVRGCRFEPRREGDGTPVRSVLTVPLIFR